MEGYVARVEESAAFLRQRLSTRPDVVIVLGSGLGSLAEMVEDATLLPFEEIPHFQPATAIGHAGRLLCGSFAGRQVALLQGRLHYYEGYSAREVTLPIRVLSRLGPSSMIISNAAGGLNPAFTAGTLMVIKDHINLIPDNPLRGPNPEEWGPRFPDLSQAYDAELARRAVTAARDVGPYATGVYVAIPGPSLETPAETRYLRSCGADAVGMSTVPEVLVARHAGLAVLAISVIANVNNPDNFTPISVDSVLATCSEASGRLAAVIAAVLA